MSTPHFVRLEVACQNCGESLAPEGLDGEDDYPEFYRPEGIPAIAVCTMCLHANPVLVEDGHCRIMHVGNAHNRMRTWNVFAR
jgi:hypothetical protein